MAACQYCKRTDLVWAGSTGEGFRLAETGGALHHCREFYESPRRLKRAKSNRQGAYLVLYGPKVAPTGARLISRSESYAVEVGTPEAFLLELQDERKKDALTAPGRRFRY